MPTYSAFLGTGSGCLPWGLYRGTCDDGSCFYSTTPTVKYSLETMKSRLEGEFERVERLSNHVLKGSLVKTVEKGSMSNQRTNSVLHEILNGFETAKGRFNRLSRAIFTG